MKPARELIAEIIQPHLGDNCPPGPPCPPWATHGKADCGLCVADKIIVALKENETK